MRAQLSDQAAGEKGAKGVTASERCVEAVLGGVATDTTCHPPMKPGDGCGG
jgi:hypothetical protein